MIKLVRYFLVLSTLNFASNAIAEIDVIKMAQQLNPIVYMQMKDKPEAEKLAKLDDLEQQIKNELAKTPNRSELYWLLGLHAWAKLYAWDNPVPLEKNRAQKAIASEAFRKALELDNPDNPDLSVDMLYSMKKFAPPDVHVEASQRILNEGPKLDRLQEIELRGGMITHFMKLERYDDVMKQIAIFEEKFPQTDYAQNGRRLYQEEIKKLQQAKQKQQDEPKDQEAAPMVEPPKQSVTQQAPEKPVTTSSADPYTSDEAQYKQWILILVLLAIGIAVIFYIIRRPRKK